MVPDEVAAFGNDVASQLASTLGDDLVGAWFVGSLALDGFVPQQSDVDIVAVCRDVLPRSQRDATAEAVYATTPRCPARGLELTLYRADVVGASPSGIGNPGFEVNVNGGPGMARAVRLTPDGEPGFWWVLDRAIAHRAGVTIWGPPARDVIADVPRALLLDAMVASMRWHRVHEKATLYSVLNATRAWCFAVEDRLVSKLEGAAWARPRWDDPAVIDAAVALRMGRAATLDGADVERLLDHVERTLTA